MGILLALVGGTPVACGSYTQQWALQAPNNPSNLLGAKSGLFQKKIVFCFDDWWGFCLLWWVESLQLVETAFSSGLSKPQTLQTCLAQNRSYFLGVFWF